MGTGIQHTARAQTSERTGITVLAHHGTVEMAIGLDHNTFAQGAVLDYAIRADDHVVLNNHATFKNHVDIDQHITTHGDFTAHIETRRVTQGHTQGHQATGFAQLVMTFQLTELFTIVGALHFHRVKGMLGGHDQTIADRHGDYVGQVVLALCVVVRQTAHPVSQATGRQGEDPGVAFGNCTFGFGCVLVLNNRTHLAIRITHDTTITSRVGQVDGQQAQLLGANLLEQTLQGLDLDQRYIAVQDQHVFCGQKW